MHTSDDHSRTTAGQPAMGWPLMMWLPMFWLGASSVSAKGGATKSDPKDGQKAGAPQSWIEAINRATAATSTLACRRTQAWQGLPAQLGRARTPQDVLEAQTRFWQTAFEQHQIAAKELAAAWIGALQMAPMPNGLAVTGRTAARDHLALGNEASRSSDGGRHVQHTGEAEQRRSAA